MESQRSKVIPVLKSLIEIPKGSNVIETRLSRVRARTEINFFIRRGEMSTLRKCKVEEDVGMVELPI
jgi:hypothetical protein